MRVMDALGWKIWGEEEGYTFLPYVAGFTPARRWEETLPDGRSSTMVLRGGITMYLSDRQPLRPNGGIEGARVGFLGGRPLDGAGKNRMLDLLADVLDENEHVTPVAASTPETDQRAWEVITHTVGATTIEEMRSSGGALLSFTIGHYEPENSIPGASASAHFDGVLRTAEDGSGVPEAAVRMARVADAMRELMFSPAEEYLKPGVDAESFLAALREPVQKLP